VAVSSAYLQHNKAVLPWGTNFRKAFAASAGRVADGVDVGLGLMMMTG
jgi:hypothetical protein